MKIGIKIFGILLVIGGVFWMLQRSSASNFKEANIKSVNGQFEITVRGERSLMSHDLISIFEERTYLDSMIFVVPRETGRINGDEISRRKGYYKLEGTIEIDNKLLSINLHSINTDDNINDPLSWNGNYTLE